MTGVFTVVSPEKCEHYARFMRHIGREQADGIFWSLFTLILILLITASTMYTKASRTFSDPENGLPDESLRTRIRQQCLLVSLICFILAIVCVIMEAFAAFSIQFCDGEDLMMLYWGAWTLVQVGSLIAIFGIMLNQWYSLSGKEHPPFNVALGTPVLVIAAVGHAAQSCISAAWQRWKKRGVEMKTTSSEDGISMRAGPTASPHPDARHIGFSLTNEPLYAFPAQ